jgi:hypothetical protein
MYELKKIWKVFTSKFVGTGPSSYKKRIYRAAVSQRLRNTDLDSSSVLLLLVSLGASYFPPSINSPTLLQPLSSGIRCSNISDCRKGITRVKFKTSSNVDVVVQDD